MFFCSFKILPLNVIPVVRGAANYSLHVPKQWYINANDFNRPRDLADYLRKVGSNYTLFSEYLKDREMYETYLLNQEESWCDLCKKINNSTEPLKVYEKIDTWWSRNDCVAPKDM